MEDAANSKTTGRRIVGKPFQPGQSGNPAGRPKAAADVIALARGHTAAAIGTLFEIATNRKAAAVARVQAANSLLERGWGKPVQPVDLDIGKNWIAELEEAAQRAENAAS